MTLFLKLLLSYLRLFLRLYLQLYLDQTLTLDSRLADLLLFPPHVHPVPSKHQLLLPEMLDLLLNCLVPEETSTSDLTHLALTLSIKPYHL